MGYSVAPSIQRPSHWAPERTWGLLDVPQISVSMPGLAHRASGPSILPDAQFMSFPPLGQTLIQPRLFLGHEGNVLDSRQTACVGSLSLGLGRGCAEAAPEVLLSLRRWSHSDNPPLFMNLSSNFNNYQFVSNLVSPIPSTPLTSDDFANLGCKSQRPCSFVCKYFSISKR